MNKLQFAKAGTPDDVMSAIWLGGSCVGHIATGHRDGSICLWDRNKCLYRAIADLQVAVSRSVLTQVVKRHTNRVRPQIGRSQGTLVPFWKAARWKGALSPCDVLFFVKKTPRPPEVLMTGGIGDTRWTPAESFGFGLEWKSRD